MTSKKYSLSQSSCVVESIIFNFFEHLEANEIVTMCSCGAKVECIELFIGTILK